MLDTSPFLGGDAVGEVAGGVSFDPATGVGVDDVGFHAQVAEALPVQDAADRQRVFGTTVFGWCRGAPVVEEVPSAVLDEGAVDVDDL